MAGIYIHIPFCRRACHYCNFHFSTTLKNQEMVIDAIAQEMVLRQHYLSESVETIYFGGGTPSLLNVDALEKLLNTARNNFDIDSSAEITLEANPDDINISRLLEWKNAGVNRLSIGIQSFYENDLQWMNRIHNAEQAQQSILLSQSAGFNNITIDLIYGTPLLPDEAWIANIAAAVSLNIPHLSCYALTVEQGTALATMIAQKKKENTDDEKQLRQFNLLMQHMEQAGYEHYEISNFSRPGFRSRHNSNYWRARPYLGLGPSAHSYNLNTRQWNIANNALYVKSIQQNVIPFEIEELTLTQQLNEYIMTGLRTSEGVSFAAVKQKWGGEHAEKILKTAAKHINRQLAVVTNEHLILTKKGKFYADGIAADLFLD